MFVRVRLTFMFPSLHPPHQNIITNLTINPSQLQRGLILLYNMRPFISKLYDVKTEVGNCERWVKELNLYK